MSPLVPMSSREPIPCRSLAPLVVIRYPAALSPPRTVGPVQPTLGCAATPTGLSTTTMSSSSWMIRIPGTGSATTSSDGLAPTAGSVTSIRAPVVTRVDLPAPAPSISMSPSVASSAARVRDRPKSRATAASTRSPSSPSGTRTLRTSPIDVLLVGVAGRGVAVAVRQAGAVHADVRHDEPQEQRRPADDRDVRDVADEEPAVVDEVDDVPVQGPRVAKEPVVEVAEGPAEQQAERDATPGGAEPGHDDEDRDGHGDRDEGHQPGHRATDGEGGAGVADESKGEEVPDEGDDPGVVERGDDPGLARLVDDEHDDGGG